MGMQALGIAGQNLANGKWVSFQHGDTEIKVGEEDDETK